MVSGDRVVNLLYQSRPKLRTMTVDASRSCLGLATSVGSAIRQIVVSRVAKPPAGAAAISSAKPPSPKLSSQRTLRWREVDSNFRSPHYISSQTGARLRHLPIGDRQAASLARG